jgi:hypothetical protein
MKANLNGNGQDLRRKDGERRRQVIFGRSIEVRLLFGKHTEEDEEDDEAAKSAV